MSFPSPGQAFGPSHGAAYGAPFGGAAGPHWQAPGFNGQMPSGVQLDPHAAALAGDDPAAIQLFQRLTSQFGPSFNWLPAVQGISQICRGLSPTEQSVVQRYLFPANAAQLDELSALRHDPLAMAEVLADDERWAHAAAGGGRTHDVGLTARPPSAPPLEKSGLPDAAVDRGGPYGPSLGLQSAGLAGFQRPQGAGHPSMAGPGHAAAPQRMPALSAGRFAAPGAVPGAAPGAPPGSPIPSAMNAGVPPAGGYPPPPAPFGSAGAPGWSGAPASPLANQAPAPAGWPGAAQPQVVSSWSTSINGGAPVVIHHSSAPMVPGAPPVVFNGAPPVMVANYPCPPMPPLAWDACGGFMPYQPVPAWHPWMGGGFGMASPYCMPDLPGAGMSLGLGVGAALASGVGSMLGSMAFGHHHHCF